MRKFILALTVVTTLALQSCIAGTDWKCDCSKELIFGTQFTNTYIISDQPKGDAQKICDFYKTEYGWDTCNLSKL